MTNTDESEFADRHPKDGEKFTALIHLARPNWECTVFPVKDGVFPHDINLFDGILIGGSPASVHDGDPWIEILFALIRQTFQAQIPMYGACFGHQAIACALGGTVGKNPTGWVFGSQPVDLLEEAHMVHIYAAHKEQVTSQPVGSEIIATTDDCPIAGFKVGNLIQTTQYHPEMTEQFFSALLDECRELIGEVHFKNGRDSLQNKPSRQEWANRIADFFERSSEEIKAT